MPLQMDASDQRSVGQSHHHPQRIMGLRGRWATTRYESYGAGWAALLRPICTIAQEGFRTRGLGV